MRAGIFIALGVTVVVAGACVPDFVFRNGASGDGGAGGDEGTGEGGRKLTRGEGGSGGGERRPTVGVGVTSSSGEGAGTPGPTSTTVGSTSTGNVSTGEGGASSQDTTTASSAETTGSTTTTGGGSTEGVPCWDGGQGQAVVCTGSESACCADTSDYDYDQCGFPGDCGTFAWELACNESADCGAQECCVNLDGFNSLYSIECGSNCSDYVACDPAVGCASGQTCNRIFQEDPAHPEYDAYGFCN